MREKIESRAKIRIAQKRNKKPNNSNTIWYNTNKKSDTISYRVSSHWRIGGVVSAYDEQIKYFRSVIPFFFGEFNSERKRPPLRKIILYTVYNKMYKNFWPLRPWANLIYKTQTVRTMASANFYLQPSLTEVFLGVIRWNSRFSYEWINFLNYLCKMFVWIFFLNMIFWARWCIG